MRSAALVTALAALGAWAGTAVADIVPVPVPVPTVSVPTVTVPTLPLPVTAPSSPVQTTIASTTTATSSAVATSLSSAQGGGSASTSSGGSSSEGSSSGGSSSGGSSSGGSSSGSSGSSAAQSTSAGGSSGSSSASRPRIARLRASRPWLARHGPKGHRSTLLTFRLRASSLVVFRIVQVSPVCSAAGSFAIHGHPGLNRVRFKGRIHGRGLAAGTYSISARPVGAPAVLHVVLVVVDSGVPTPTELAAARRSDVCVTTARQGLASVVLNDGSASIGSGTERQDHHPTASAAGSDDSEHGVLGAARRALSPAEVAKQVSNPLVIAALALAMVLLGVAALPRAAVADPRLDALLVRHRTAVALAGAAALIAAIVALGFG